MYFSRRTLLAAAVLANACDSAAGTTADGGSSGGTTGAELAVLPIAVDCSYVFEQQQVDQTYEVGDVDDPIPVGGELLAHAVLHDDEYESRSFSITIYAEDGSVGTSVLYQMSRHQLPQNEFHGDHGFTGLNAVTDPVTGESVQFACFARDPSDPPHAWEN